MNEFLHPDIAEKSLDLTLFNKSNYLQATLKMGNSETILISPLGPAIK